MAGTSSLLAAALCLACRLEGKVAIITGGSSGLGAYTARFFAKHGAKVVIADIQDNLGQSVCKDIGPSSATYVHCDVTNEAEVQNAVNTAVAKHGKLDIMFNNAAVLGITKPDIIDNNKDEFEHALRVNIVGPFLGTKHAARVMIPARRGSIINHGSVAATVGGIASHSYTSSKHALIGLTKNTAAELGKYGIRVNCLSPYLVATPLAMEFFKLDNDGISSVYSGLKGILKGTILTPEDVAEAALYLASDESKYVSGHNLQVDGGFTKVNPSFGIYSQ